MSSAFRILVLFCLAATVMNAFYNFVNNLLYAAQITGFPDLESNSGPPSTKLQTTSVKNVYPVKDIIPLNDSDINLEVVEKKYPEVRQGGWYTPPNGTIQDKVAIIVPYRDREKHLTIFLNHMHPFLMKQQIEYRIFIVEQEGTRPFNRGKLLNVGFVESQKTGGWQCFIFHDVDLLPLDQRNIYTCSQQPKHMSAAIDKSNFELPYPNIFGGVTALTMEQFKNVNGYSNRYWGWGGEDDDMSKRLKKMDYNITRYDMSISRYAMLHHNVSQPCLRRWKLLLEMTKTFKDDGLSSLEYVVRMITRHHLYTHIVANLDERKSKLDDSAVVDAHMLFGDKL